jgi:hypothetical protein
MGAEEKPPTEEELVQFIREAKRRKNMNAAKKAMVLLDKMNREKFNPFDAEGNLDLTQGINPVMTGADITNAVIGTAGGDIAGGLTGIASLPAGVDTAVSNMEAVQEAFSRPPQTEGGEQALQKLGELIQSGFDHANVPLGLMGKYIEMITGDDPKTAKKVQQDIEQNGFTDTYTESVYQQTKSPLIAALAKLLPSAVPELIAIATGTKAYMPKKIRSSELPKSTPDGEIPTADYQEILEGLAQKQPDAPVLDVMPDPEIIAAAEELGVVLNPDHYSNNRAFQEVVQSLKSRPGTSLAPIEAKAIEDLGNRADELILDLGGQLDKSILDSDVKLRYEKIHSNLDKQAEKAYAAVNNAVPNRAQVYAEESRAYIQKALEDLGGDKSRLTAAEKSLLKLLDGNPTYAALDRIRKDVGNGFKNQGPFKDADQGILSQVYKALSIDQQNAANAFGVGGQYELGRKLTQDRKKLEKQMVAAFGREANASIIPKLKSAASSLVAGDVTKLQKLMETLPKGQEISRA